MSSCSEEFSLERYTIELKLPFHIALIAPLLADPKTLRRTFINHLNIDRPWVLNIPPSAPFFTPPTEYLNYIKIKYIIQPR